MSANKSVLAQADEAAGLSGAASRDLLRDIELTVTIELGRARMTLADVMKLGEGSVLVLDRAADEPVDIVVNDRIVARGEVVVIDEKFAVRVTEILPVKEEVL